MRKISILIILFFFIIPSYVSANVMPSGPIEMRQPDGTTFLARFFGDGFLCWAETIEGYAIAVNPADGYWYYAQRGQRGDLVPTSYQVGKANHVNLGLIPHLTPSQQLMELAEQQRAAFNASLTMTSTTGTKTLGVILIEFADANTNPDAKGGSYDNDDYEVLFFSEDYYNTDKNGVRSPDLEKVYGSIRDYFLEVSYNQLSITGDILNPKSGGNGPYEWLIADSTKHFYSFNTSYKDILIKEAVEKARIAPGFKDPDD